MHSVEEYAARLTNASPLQIIIINYEIILESIEDAQMNMDFNESVRRARNFLKLLMDALDVSLPISQNLLSIYLYVNEHLSRAAVTGNFDSLEIAAQLMRDLYESWKELERQESGATPVMENTEQIYAGLTYSGNGLDEYVANEENRGIRV